MAALLGDLLPQHGAQEENVEDLIPHEPKPTTTSALPTYKSAFLQSCLSASVLTFGNFTLKSGRQSPYFFNAGLFYSASLLRSISTAFAQTLVHHISLNPDFEFDVLFGPRYTLIFVIAHSSFSISGTADFEFIQAYKGVPLATATADKLAGLDEAKFGEVAYSFNRKETKDHGEGGVIVGAPLKGKRVVIIDDVITAGTAMKEAISIIKQQGGTLVGVVIALDRMERMNDQGSGSAIEEVQKDYGVPVLSIINLDDLIGALGESGDEQEMLRVEEYKRKYGASD